MYRICMIIPCIVLLQHDWLTKELHECTGGYNKVANKSIYFRIYSLTFDCGIFPETWQKNLVFTSCNMLSLYKS